MEEQETEKEGRGLKKSRGCLNQDKMLTDNDALASLEMSNSTEDVTSPSPLHALPSHHRHHHSNVEFRRDSHSPQSPATTDRRVVIRDPPLESPSPQSSSAEGRTSVSQSSVFHLIAKPILAGALTGGLEAIIMYPTEYVKTHLQLQDKKNPRYHGMIDCYRQTVRENGFLGLYRGVTPLVIGSIPKQASRWGSYECSCSGMLELKRYLFGISSQQRLTKKDLTMAEISVCGFIAGSVEALVAVVPTETVKTVLIHDERSVQPRFANRSLVYVVSTLLREDGIRGIYRGVSNTVTKQGLNQCTRFPSQLAAMNVFCGGGREHRRKSPVWNGAAGFCAGVFSVLITQPFDVVKTKMQGNDRHQYKSSWDCWQKTAKWNGVGHFYAGSAARTIRVGGNVALTFTLFPLIKDLL